MSHPEFSLLAVMLYLVPYAYEQWLRLLTHFHWLRLVSTIADFYVAVLTFVNYCVAASTFLEKQNIDNKI